VAGVHGGYTSITSDCQACHFLHEAPGSKKLLFDDTVQAVCMTCHDSTGAGGVYGNLAARGVSVAASHSFDAEDVIPGGHGTTGGDRTQSFTGEGGMLSCDDCHSPHDARTVAPFLGDRKRGMDAGGPPSSKLLKTRPTSSLTTVTVYGSDWCSSCHRGRHSGGSVINHPVDSLVVTTTPLVYGNVAKVTAAGSLTTTLGTMGWSNFGYVMPTPRTADQAGHAPICQQCHEDARSVGEPGAAVPYSVTQAYGQNPANNPRFQDFPHETSNPSFLIEVEDDLCLNCHPAATLP
jgi:predicted CXXCH cytochrome family protein